jgi:hypothetical protein
MACQFSATCGERNEVMKQNMAEYYGIARYLTTEWLQRPMTAITKNITDASDFNSSMNPSLRTPEIFMQFCNLKAAAVKASTDD